MAGFRILYSYSPAVGLAVVVHANRIRVRRHPPVTYAFQFDDVRAIPVLSGEQCESVQALVGHQPLVTSRGAELRVAVAHRRTARYVVPD